MIKTIIKFHLLILLPGTLAMSCSKTDTSVGQPMSTIESQTQGNNSAGVINIRDVPVNSVFFNDCCSEAILVSGTAHFVVSKNTIHLQVSDMTGIGLSTNYNYVGQGSSVETNVFYADQFEGTLTFMLNMTNDNGCSFRLKATLHTTMNANGDITAIVETIKANCD